MYLAHLNKLTLPLFVQLLIENNIIGITTTVFYFYITQLIVYIISNSCFLLDFNTEYSVMFSNHVCV